MRDPHHATLYAVTKWNEQSPHEAIEHLMTDARRRLEEKAETALKETETLTPQLAYVYHEIYVVGNSVFFILTGEVRRKKKRRS